MLKEKIKHILEPIRGLIGRTDSETGSYLRHERYQTDTPIRKLKHAVRTVVSLRDSNRTHLGYVPTVALMLVMATAAQAQKTLPAGTGKDSFIKVEVNDINLNEETNVIGVNLNVDLYNAHPRANFESTYTPMFVKDNDTIRLESFTVTGRNRYYYHLRNEGTEATDITFYKGNLLGNVTNSMQGKGWKMDYNPRSRVAQFRYNTPYKDWMDDAYLVIENVTTGCADCPKPDYDREVPLAHTQYTYVEPYKNTTYIYITPEAEAVKMREISARAYIDFPVNRTELYPDYRRNPIELAKIRGTIDSVRNDKDITVKSLHIAGTASPEGGYQNNIRLASGRTETLKNYVQMLYSFPYGFITTSFEPVDWTGLRDYLEAVIRNKPSGFNVPTASMYELPHAMEILAIVNSGIEPYARNQKIKTTYPAEYKWLLDNVYPALRHSDYRIEFEIKTYTEVAEILEVMQTNPKKLSLAELFVAANSQPVGSELYNRAFDLAVTMFPDNETANLNAALTAIKNNELDRAEWYLLKAGSTPEAEYARAMLRDAKGDEEGALEIYRTLTYSTNPQVANAARTVLKGVEEANAAAGFQWTPVE